MKPLNLQSFRKPKQSHLQKTTQQNPPKVDDFMVQINKKAIYAHKNGQLKDLEEMKKFSLI